MDLNPENQLIPLRKHAENLGFTVVEEYVDYASDTKQDRPKLQAALSQLKSKEADLLLVYSIDRLARSLGHLIRIVEDLRKCERGIVIMRENLNLARKDPQSEFTLMILGALAQYEASLISSRTKNALAVSKLKGKNLGRPLKRTPELERSMFELSSEGLSVREIARKLKSVSRSAVQSILKQRKQT